MADTIIGIKFNEFVLLSAAGLGAHYYIKITDTEDKMAQLDSHKLLVVNGEDGPRKNFQEYIRCNLQLNRMRQHGQVSSTPSTASFIRNELASALRSRGGAYECASLLAGVDSSDMNTYDHDDDADEDDNEEQVAAKAEHIAEKAEKAIGESTTHLYWLDYLGTSQSVPYGAHGYGATFLISILDRYYKPDMTPQEGVDLLQKCIDEVKRRVIISTPHFITRVITKDGVQLLEHCK